VKSALRSSAADGTTKHKVNVAIARGWKPGAGPPREFLRSRRRRRSQIEEVRP
jgi:hypothetical protein